MDCKDAYFIAGGIMVGFLLKRNLHITANLVLCHGRWYIFTRHKCGLVKRRCGRNQMNYSTPTKISNFHSATKGPSVYYSPWHGTMAPPKKLSTQHFKITNWLLMKNPNCRFSVINFPTANSLLVCEEHDVCDHDGFSLLMIFECYSVLFCTYFRRTTT